ncbi:hypothetical protein HDU93_008322, partial [Gonapodya sp. JEL0774]
MDVLMMFSPRREGGSRVKYIPSNSGPGDRNIEWSKSAMRAPVTEYGNYVRLVDIGLRPSITEDTQS